MGLMMKKMIPKRISSKKNLKSNDESISNDNGSVVCKHPSRIIHRAGCVQQHAPCDREERKMHYWTCQGISEFIQGGVASNLMARDYKDGRDLVQEDIQMNEQTESKENYRTERKYVLRRLTPTECARLQGFPDWWCDGAEGSDSSMYRLWGNGVALPCVVDVLGRLAKELRSESE